MTHCGTRDFTLKCVPTAAISNAKRQQYENGKYIDIKTGVSHYHSQLRLKDKSCTINELVVCNSWDLKPA